MKNTSLRYIKITGIFFLLYASVTSLSPAFAWNMKHSMHIQNSSSTIITNTNNNANPITQNVEQNANPNIAIENNNNPDISNNNDITINSVPVVTVAPPIQITSLPSTGSETGIVFALISFFPLGFILKKYANPI